MILHWNGAQWGRVASGTSRRLYGVWAGSSDNAIAVGDGVILRWNGERWATPPRDEVDLR